MRIPQFTVKRLMVAVALAGLVMGFEITRRRREAFLEMAWDFRVTEVGCRQQSEEPPGPHSHPEMMRRLADYCETLQKKYEQAARFPWLSVDPDPPVPW